MTEQSPNDNRSQRRLAVGALLAQARGDRSQAAVARAVGVARSTLCEYEKGKTLPSREVATLLDSELGLQGDLVTALLGSRGHRMRLSADRADHFSHCFPPSYIGPVWIALHAAGDTRVALAWGPWVYQRALPFDGQLCLRTGKGFDRSGSVPLLVRTDRPVRAAFGVGDPPAPLEDISLSWSPRQGWAVNNAAHMLTSIITEHGRTLNDFARFLGVTRAVLDTLLGGASVDTTTTTSHA